MKTAMNAHVENERHRMFRQSVDGVRHSLETLTKEVESTMIDKTYEVFALIQRDYRSVLVGSNASQGQLLPKAQRILHRNIMDLIDDVKGLFSSIASGQFQQQEAEEQAPPNGVDSSEDDLGQSPMKVTQTRSLSPPQEKTLLPSHQGSPRTNDFDEGLPMVKAESQSLSPPTNAANSLGGVDDQKPLLSIESAKLTPAPLNATEDAEQSSGFGPAKSFEADINVEQGAPKALAAQSEGSSASSDSFDESD